MTLPRLKRVGFLGSPLRPVRASYAVMHGISTVSSSVTSRVPHGSLDVDARLGFRRTRPRSTLQVLPAQRFVGGTPYLYFQEPRESLFPMGILPHLPPTMLCPPGADVGGSMYPIPEGMGFIAPPHPLFPIRTRTPSWDESQKQQGGRQKPPQSIDERRQRCPIIAKIGCV